jgi:Rrf2 family protein
MNERLNYCNQKILHNFCRKFPKKIKKQRKNLTIFIQYMYIDSIMFITKESDYAVRIIRELSGSGRESVRDICSSESIPVQYSYKILKKLEKGGLVQGYRGINGGYELAKDPKKIRLYDVITAVDEELLLSECLGHGFHCPMKGKGKRSCGVHGEFARIQGIILSHLMEKPLADIF